MPTDDHRNSNVTQYSSTRYRFVTRAVIESKLHSLTWVFDNVFIIQDMLQEIIGRCYPIKSNIELNSVLDIVVKMAK